MLVVGLTGSIGMGKSTTADMFRAEGVPVHDSDATVHELYRGEAVPLIEAAFPSVVVDGRVDRQLLAPLVLGDTEKMRLLESIVHPLVWNREAAFLEHQAQHGARVAIIDIPILFEARDVDSFDVIVVVTASPDIQRARVLSRPGMTAEKFELILAKQLPDVEKRRRAHFLIETDYGLGQARQQVWAIIRSLSACQMGSKRDA